MGFLIYKNMKEIKLTQGKVALVDDEDYERLNQFKWCAVFDRNTFYAVRAKKRSEGKDRMIKMHWDILGLKGVDHIDHNGLNCQKSNLRKCTHQQNMMNRTANKNSTSKYKGVSFVSSRNKWLASISTHGKAINLGRHDNEKDAALAYDKKAIELFGEFAYLNFKQYE